MHPGNAEAFTFLIIVPLLLLFSLTMEILFDNPAKDFSNQLCKMMMIKDDENKSMSANFYKFVVDIFLFIKSQIFVVSIITIEYSFVLYLLIQKK